MGLTVHSSEILIVQDVQSAQLICIKFTTVASNWNSELFKPKIHLRLAYIYKTLRLKNRTFHVNWFPAISSIDRILGV